MKLSKDKKDKLVLSCLGFVGAAGLLYTFVLGAQNDRLASLNRQSISLRDKVIAADRLLHSKPTIEADLASNTAALTAREEGMSPSGQYFYWFLKLMDQFREKENLNASFIVDITQPEFGNAGLYPAMPYRSASFGVLLNGQFQDIGRFISDLENEFPYFRVQNLKIVPGGARGATAASMKPSLVQRAESNLLVEIRIVTLVRGGAS